MFQIKKTLGMVSYGLGDGDLIFNCFSCKLQPLPYVVSKRLKKCEASPISRIKHLPIRLIKCNISGLLGDGDLAVVKSPS